MSERATAPDHRARPPRRRLLAVGSLAVLLPLAGLLALQYTWLLKLEEASLAAGREALRGYLDGIAKTARFRVAEDARLALDVPSEAFEPGKIQRAAKRFAKHPVVGARRLFVVHYRSEDGMSILFFDPETRTLAATDQPQEERAVYVASAPWTIVQKKGLPVGKPSLEIDERDREHRLAFTQILDDDSRLVGLTGMILDREAWLRTVLPEAIKEVIPTASRQKLTVVVRDGNGEIVLPADGHPPSHEKAHFRRPLDPFFADWKISLVGDLTDVARWARLRFAFNLSLLVVLALVLLGSVLLLLSTTARELRLSQMKSDFVSNVSHELRTPLASIRVFGELLRHGRVGGPERVRQYGEHIETESRRLTQLINNILDFSRIESGRKVYHPVEDDLVAAVEGVIGTFRVRLEQEGFQIHLETPAEPLPRLPFDRAALRQALANLLDNAAKYSNGGREVTVEVRRRRRHAVISVRDRGIGIPAAEQRKIFERFHRVGNAAVHDVKGSGLGLSIVRHVVEAHGGRVEVESAPGRGSTFAIWLPMDGPAGPRRPASNPFLRSKLWNVRS